MFTMRALLTLLTIALATPVAATDAGLPAIEQWDADRTTIFDGTEVGLEEFLWLARPVVVFADTPADPRFQQQVELLTTRSDELAERDVVIIADTDPSARSSVRTSLRPRGFMLAILAKDGTVMLRKPFPWDVREISRSIDKLPLRQQEIRYRRAETQN